MRIGFSQNISIANRKIGYGQPVFIIAEAGVAHFGSIDKAKALVDMAVSAGADAVKFQVFKTRELISHESKEWIDRLQSKELPFEAFKEIDSYCRNQGIIFFATAHDEFSLAYLDSINMPIHKIGSGEVGNWPFIKEVALRKKPVILSTGMYTLDEINTALSIFSDVKNPDIALLHCVTQYPTPPEEVNLKAIDTLRTNFNVIVGYSDHTEGIHFSLAAVSIGAKIIEKHISLDFNIPNAQDWKVSCGPEELAIMISQIRDLEKGMGSGEKVPQKGELAGMDWAKKSIVAARDISTGEVITARSVKAKRPGYGISPSQLEKVIGRKAKADIQKDTIIKWEQII